MSKFIFKRIESPEHGTDVVEMTIEAETWYDVVPRFKEFLLGCGFMFEGELEVVDYNVEDIVPKKLKRRNDL